jgi:hypothetical protein
MTEVDACSLLGHLLLVPSYLVMTTIPVTIGIETVSLPLVGITILVMTGIETVSLPPVMITVLVMSMEGRHASMLDRQYAALILLL